MTWDTIIVGAGPAGATAAVYLARAGHKVLLIDKENFPRHKICGDGLITDSLRCLNKIGVLEEVENKGKVVNILSYYSPSQIRVDTESKMVVIKRFHLDEIIVKEAIKSGVNFAVEKVVDINQDENYVYVYTKNSVFKSKTCILATGANITIGKKLGIISNPKPNAVAIRCYVKSPIVLERLVFSYDKKIAPGYGWVFPLPDGEFNVGCGVLQDKILTDNLNLHQVFDRFVSVFPLAKEIIDKASEKSKLVGAPLRCGFVGTNTFRLGKILSVGESIGTTFLFTGEGIGKAMESAEVASSVIDKFLKTENQDVFYEFKDFIKNTLNPKYDSYRKAEKWLTKLWLNDFLARRAQTSKYIQKCLVDLLEERKTPTDFISLKELLKYFIN